MTRRVELDIAYQEDFVPGEHDGFVMRIDARCEGMPSEIFRYRQLPLRPGTAEMIGVLDGVCTSVDLADLPLDAPRQNETPPWYRAAFAEIIFSTRDEAERFQASITTSLVILVRSLNAQDNLVRTTRVVITSDGPEPDGGSSSLSSQSG